MSQEKMICRRKAAIIYASTGYAPFTDNPGILSE
jgi:hypothetical protein